MKTPHFIFVGLGILGIGIVSINLVTLASAMDYSYVDNYNQDDYFYQFEGLDNLHHPMEGNLTFRELIAKEKCKSRIHRFACLLKNYNSMLPPRQSGNLVKVYFDIIDVPEIDDNRHTMTIVLELVLQWQEPRLVLDPNRTTAINIDSEGLKRLWIPNVMFDRQHKLAQIGLFQDSKGGAVRDGEMIEFWTYIEVTVYCDMSFEHFPMDEQTCKFALSSLSSPEELMHFEFDVSTSQQNNRLQMYELNIKPFTDPSDLRWEYPAANYSICGFHVKMRRISSTYILIYYVPCTGMVLVSWISFLVDPNIVPGRTALLVTIFLVLTTIFSGIQRDTPRSQGLTALGQYALVCLTFVFLAMLEFATLLFLERFSAHKQKREARKEENSSRWGVPSIQDQAKAEKKAKRTKQWIKDVASTSYWMDQIALALFPIGFAIFNLVHFTQYN
ncbi:hypothetical protein TCAL_09458 [Tigriopus californicus]|uniref:Neurotransmitter-gated ion-channel ligand-binding domain-containing protein n=1 Tax=Tigriopus californicus TaxID=6832 RepID=A0A553PK67_TIGCA|nr:gamma-aminobutyric acid receptor subunit rho-2-like [Tigriopus californicus]TRY78074.1 hypothetical protein TCAL_09458 [Tigriopus californicus]|eukprot:TCALIF_09458-PA protein Name:"Similar to GABRR2 Gamma-aminobutyric acid receptor subunit rho-2 (Homo sapiens)" AED:0.08 eAED:0.08 QI:0/1/0/1/1/1/2/0/443